MMKPLIKLIKSANPDPINTTITILNNESPIREAMSTVIRDIVAPKERSTQPTKMTKP